MQVKLCENISKNELGEIKRMVSEAFVSNEQILLAAKVLRVSTG